MDYIIKLWEKSPMSVRYITFFMLGILLGFFVSCSSINKKLGLRDDNVAEELIEEAIDHYTGLDLDLTPSTPEK